MNDYIIDAFTREGNNTNLEVDNLTVGCITSKNNSFDLDSNGNLTINTLNVGSINKNPIVDIIYPVESIYISINATNPETLFGGTWEQIEDKFLLSAGTTYTAGTTGGEATHRITTAEMPSHTHSLLGSSGTGWKAETVPYGSSTSGTGMYAVQYTGGSQPHNNMPPYLTVYIWKRTS